MAHSCSLPPPLSEEEITAALDGEADSSVLRHIEQCISCRTRFEQAGQVEQMLKTQLHPTSQDLGDYHLGLIAGQSERAAIERHLVQCARCRDEIEELRLFLADERSQVRQATPEPPRLSLGAVHRRLNEIIARLAPNTPALALRGVGTGPVVMEADGATVFLETHSTHAGQILAGQIVAADPQQWADALVIVRQTNDVLITAVVDETGQFRCGPIQAGLLAIRITSAGGQTLILDGIEF